MRKIREIDSLNAQAKECLKLYYAATQFSQKMYLKLKEKHFEGYEGWDWTGDTEDEVKFNLQNNLQEHFTKPLTKDNLVDIANFCMMLWHREEIDD